VRLAMSSDTGITSARISAIRARSPDSPSGRAPNLGGGYVDTGASTDHRSSCASQRWTPARPSARFRHGAGRQRRAAVLERGSDGARTRPERRDVAVLAPEHVRPAEFGQDQLVITLPGYHREDPLAFISGCVTAHRNASAPGRGEENKLDLEFGAGAGSQRLELPWLTETRQEPQG